MSKLAQHHLLNKPTSILISNSQRCLVLHGPDLSHSGFGLLYFGQIPISASCVVLPGPPPGLPSSVSAANHAVVEVLCFILLPFDKNEWEREKNQGVGLCHKKTVLINRIQNRSHLVSKKTFSSTRCLLDVM